MILDRLFGVEQRATLNEPPDWMWDAFGGQRTQTGETVSETSALGLIAVAAAVKLLAGAVAQCPLIVYKGEGGQRVRARDSWQWRLLHDRPNPETPPDAFFETLMGHENLWGNYYAEKVKAQASGRTVVGELWPIAPSRVKVERDSNGAKRFVLDGGKSFGTDTVLHIPGFGTDGLKGMSPISHAREELGVAMAMQKFAARAFANGGRHAGVITFPLGKRFDNPEKRDQFIAQWRSAMGSNGTPVLEDGTDWKQIGMPVKDMELVAIMRFTVNHVARIFQVPPEMIGGDRNDSMTYATVEGQALHFVKFSLARWLVRIEQALRHDQDLFPEGLGLYPEFLVEGLLRGDTTSRSGFYTAMFGLVDGEGKRALGVDEIRERENLPPAAAGVVAQDPSVAGQARELASALLETRGRVEALEREEVRSEDRRVADQRQLSLLQQIAEKPLPEVRVEVDATTTVAPGAISAPDVTVEAAPAPSVQVGADVAQVRAEFERVMEEASERRFEYDQDGLVCRVLTVGVDGRVRASKQVVRDHDGRLAGLQDEPVVPAR